MKNKYRNILVSAIIICLGFSSIAFGQSDIPRGDRSPVFLDSTNPEPPLITVAVNTTPTPGAIFLSNFGWGYGEADPHLLILNNDGSIIQKKYLQATTGTGFRMQTNGTLSFYSESEQKFYILDSNLNTIKTVGATNGYQTDDHELVYLPNGNYILIALTHRQQDMSPITPGGSELATIVGNIIQEYDENGNIVFEWLTDHHFKITDVTHVDLTTDRIDYCHANAVDVDHDGNLLLSSRHLDEITKINRTTGEIIWRWGGKNNQFTFINDTLGFSHQHSIRVIPNGNYILFDNGNFHNPPVSRVCEYIIDTASMTATLVREFRHSPDLYSLAMGSIQYLDNGNWLIGWGSNSSVAVTEVTPSGETVLEMSMPNGDVSYRAYKFPWQKPLSAVNETSVNTVSVMCYPNPSSSIFHVEYELSTPETVTISVVDCLGRIVSIENEIRSSIGKNKHTVDISGFPNGVYKCILSTQGQKIWTTIIKQ
ncbi:MAG TPA: aryl-sulfate sulfotransferase [Candidatus Kapabacteria bacterium]